MKYCQPRTYLLYLSLQAASAIFLLINHSVHIFILSQHSLFPLFFQLIKSMVFPIRKAD